MNKDIAIVFDPESKHSGERNKIVDYSEILKYYNLSYKTVPPYLQVGEITQIQGWILDLSVIKIQIVDLLNTIIPLLIVENIPFKIAINQEIAGHLLAGLFNYAELGKVVCIYPASEYKTVKIAKKIIELTQCFNGPHIPSDLYLGGCLYTRYGGFKPLIRTDPKGKKHKYIYDSEQNLIIDNPTIPFILPKGVRWPFSEVKNFSIPKLKKLLNNTYKQIVVIKPDAKGSVTKGIYFKRMLYPKWCIIKQGKKNMLADEIGRDINDRLVWQEELYNSLKGEIPMPKVLDLLNDCGDTYLVLEYINGVTLNQAISMLRGDLQWINIPLSNRLILLNYLFTILRIIDHLHNKGYVHRDITPFNFMVDRRNRIYLIDMELTYSLTNNIPTPPFKTGTFGFMSPEQETLKTPSIKEDIYGLGGLMIYLFTGLLPGKIDITNIEWLQECLHFFIPSNNVIDIIVSCFREDPNYRPGIANILDILQKYEEDLSSPTMFPEIVTFKKTDKGKITKTIQAVLKTLSNHYMIDHDGLWKSKKKMDDNIMGNEQMGLSNYCGLYEGISGVMYLLACSKRIGFEINDCLETYIKNYDYIQTAYLDLINDIVGGLYYGASGIAVALATGIQCSLLPYSNTINLQIKESLQRPLFGLDIATGISGNGVAILHCSTYLDEKFTTNLLEQYVDMLIMNQYNDGSWNMTPDIPEAKGLKISGFSNGIAGIIWFLLIYGDFFSNKQALQAAEKGLQWLAKQGIKKNNQIFWFISNKNKQVEPWFNNGSAGIALTFIKAYELFQKPSYKTIAEDALRFITHKPICGEFSLGMGLSGLGEVYLEAASIFKADEWQEKADWISEIFMHSFKLPSDGSVYWINNSVDSFPTADLMVGNSGIIHFLQRYIGPDKLSFPLLPDFKLIK